MVEVIFDIQFKKEFKKIKDKNIKEKIINQVAKIKDNPNIGKPMKYSRKGTREVYISPWRLSYLIDNEIVYILALYHKDQQ